ncbi:YggT family protein [Acetobacteraceae bacterium]|nr:YggT family protein [Acetobacteraceae bacterium]
MNVQYLVTVFNLLFFLMDAYIYVIIAYCIVGTVLTFGLINPDNRFMVSVYQVLVNLVEPALAPFRAIIPQIGMIDLSPLALLLTLQFLLPYILRSILHGLIGLYGVY